MGKMYEFFEWIDNLEDAKFFAGLCLIFIVMYLIDKWDNYLRRKRWDQK